MASQDINISSSGEDVSDLCHICKEKFNQPRVLSCLHVFCEECLKKQFPENGILHNAIECVLCEQQTKLSSKGISGLPLDYITCNRIDPKSMEMKDIICTSCTADKKSIARCTECDCFLCTNCSRAHQFMRCFESHTVVSFEEMKRNGDSLIIIRNPVNCTSHPAEVLKFYCHTCHIPICSECTILDHKRPEHSYEKAVDAEKKVIADLKNLIAECKNKVTYCREANVETHLSELQEQRDNAKSHIQEIFRRFKAILEKQQKKLLEEIKQIHSSQEIQLKNTFDKVQKTIGEINDACKFAERLLNCRNTSEVLSLIHDVQAQLLSQINNVPNLNRPEEITFETDESTFESTIKEISGHVKNTESPVEPPEPKDFFISQKVSPMHSILSFESNVSNLSTGIVPFDNTLPSIGVDFKNNLTARLNLVQLSNLVQRNPITSLSSESLASACLNEKITFSGEPYFTTDQLNEMNYLTAPIINTESASLTNALSHEANGSYSTSERSSHANRSKLVIRNILGDLGSGDRQFNCPHGFCLGLNEEIIVADTNNHRIQILEETGKFNQFGVQGKENGNLWCPRKVAVLQSSGKFVVCDKGRAPSRIQIFTKTGQFLKAIDKIYIPPITGVITTRDDTIVVVTKSIQSVYVISEAGDILRKFDCKRYIKKPSDIAVYQEELYICDFEGHCVAVFSDTGYFLRKIDCRNVTVFPTGIDISPNGDVFIGDSHGNQFHIVVFSTEGNLLSELQCPYVMPRRCCGLKITSEGFVITLDKNNHQILIINIQCIF